MRFWMSLALVLAFVSLSAPTTALAESRGGCTGKPLSCAEQCNADFDAEKAQCDAAAEAGHAACEVATDQCLTNCGGDTSCEETCVGYQAICHAPVVGGFIECLKGAGENLHECGQDCPCDLCSVEGEIATELCLEAAALVRLGCDEALMVCNDTCTGPGCFACQPTFDICVGIAEGLAESCPLIGDELTEECLEVCEIGRW